MLTVSDEERAVAREYLPPIVYLPAARFGGGQGPEVQFRELEQGGIALLAYTALDRMARCLGPRQPWVMIETSKLAEIMDRHEAKQLHFDLPLPEELWHHNWKRR